MKIFSVFSILQLFYVQTNVMKNNPSFPFFHEGSELGELIRNYNWAATSLGKLEDWPQHLRTCVNILLNSRFPMFVWWGPELITLYNDAYRIIAGDKHPLALGKPGRNVWSEIWNVVGPLADQVMEKGTSTWAEDQLLYICRHGYMEESYFTFSYSPVFDEEGTVSGVFCACTETTEKVLAARKVQQSEQNLRNTILQAPVGMCILRGPTFIVEIANSPMYELWGRGAEELQHKPIFEGLPEAANIGYEEPLLQVFTTGQPFSGKEHPVTVPRNGQLKTVYVNFAYEPFREPDGAITGVIATASDVTEQALTKQKLKENEVQLQVRVKERTAALEKQGLFISSILDASFNGIYSLQAVRNEVGTIHDFRYLFANNLISQLLGMSAEEIVGKSMLTLIPENKTNGFFDLFCQALRERKPVRDETHFRTETLDNWFDYAIVPIDKEALVVTIQDITAQKKAMLQIEQQKNLLDNLLEHSPSGITITEMIRNEHGVVIDGKTILANAPSQKYTGISAEAMLSRRLSQNDPNILNSSLFEQALHTLRTGEPFIIQYFLEPTRRWLELAVARMDENHLINVFTDVTPIKETQLQLEKYVEDLRRSNQNLEEFAHAASHDLKEPIRKIRTFSDRLKHQLSARLNEQEADLFNRMERATERMQLLIDDLLDYSHVSQQTHRIEEVDLNQKLIKVLEDLELDIQQKKAIIMIGTLPVVKGYRRQLQQLFQNLVSNAIKYSKPGVEPQIHITSQVVRGGDVLANILETDRGNTFYLIVVKDNGIGFEQDQADRIFKMFHRLHGKAEYAGTGIGLAIARKVVESHQGYIWAQSEPGMGSQFKVLLPAE